MVKRVKYQWLEGKEDHSNMLLGALIHWGIMKISCNMSLSTTIK